MATELPTNYKADNFGGGDVCLAIVGDHDSRITDFTHLVVEPTGFRDTGQGDYWSEAPASGTIRAEGENRPSRPANIVVEAPVDAKGVWRDSKSLPPCFHLNTRDELIPTEIPGALLASSTGQCQAYIPVEIPAWWDGGQCADTITCTSDRQLMPDRKRLPCVVEPPRCFTQNQREEIRLLGGDGEVAGAVSAEPGIHQQNYLATASTFCFVPYGTRLGEVKGGSAATMTRMDAKFPQCIAVVPPPKIYTIDSEGGNSMKSSNPNSGIHEAETAKTLDTTIPTPNKGQGGQMIVEPPAYALSPMLIGRKPENGGNGRGYHEEVAYTQDTVGVGGVAAPREPLVVDMMGGKTAFHTERKGVTPTITTAHGECHAIVEQPDKESKMETPENTPVPDDRPTVGGASFDVNFGCPVEPELSHTFKAESSGHNTGAVFPPAEDAPAATACVRRLTPIEAEILMGFPPNYTKISYRGKPIEECPDAPRYKACGNSFCVNVVRWIGKRIDMVEAKIREKEAAGDK